MQTEDGQIIHECLNDEYAEFGLLVDKYKEGIYALAYSKLGNFHDAQDITQETFIKAYTKLHTLKHWDSFAIWLGAIACNLCKQLIRSRSRRPDRDFAEDHPPEIIDKISIESYQDNSVYQSLNDALESLPETYRQVLALHYFSGMKSMEIARILGVSLRTVTERLRMGRERLKEEMIDMMSATFKEQKLPAGFTFKIVELVKRIKIHPVSTTKGLPWGLSLATGLLIAVLSINPALVNFNDVGTPIFAPLPVESKVLKVGEIPVDVVKISNIPILSSSMGKGKGGEFKPDMQNALFMAPQGEGEWVKKADMPTPRGGPATAVINGKIYAIGGYDGNSLLPNVEEYDPIADKWTKKANMPTARKTRVSVVNGKIYAIGGSNFSPISIVEEYDPVADKWTKKADMPTARWGLSVSAVNGKIYAIGGGIIKPGEFFSLATVEEYDPAMDKWTNKADMPTARSCLDTCVVNGKIYAIGGYSEDGGDVFATVEEYDPVADKWTKKTDMPTARWYLATSTVNGKIYAIGGISKEGDNIPATVATVEEYDPVADKWTKKADMPTARDDLSASTVNGKIYAIGGWGGFTTVEEYTPEGGQAVSPQGKLPTRWGKLRK